MLVDRVYNILAVYQIILTSISVCYSQVLSSSECKELGFSSSTLLCSACDELKQFKLSHLEKSCKQCCIVDREDKEKKRYSSAVLEVCSWKLGRYPQVQAFIQSDRPSKYPNFRVQYARGKEPTLVLYDENNVEIESLGIDQWTTDTVEEYLNEVLGV